MIEPTPAPTRIWVVGFGTVGQWLIRALSETGREIAERHGVRFEVVGIASRRSGFVWDEAGLDLERALELAEGGGALSDLPADARFETALEGLRTTEADVLVEVSQSPASNGEPGLSHLLEALGRGIPAVTSNKWPVALNGVELKRVAARQGTILRAESTVMSGTPVLRALTAGLAGARPSALRGVVNATVNFILTRMDEGIAYSDALAEAQRLGLAEPDPTEDVEAHDSVAKAMILAALVLGHQLERDEVVRTGISSLDEAMIPGARETGSVVREVTSIAIVDGDVEAGVEPIALPAADPLASIEGTGNAVICQADPLGEVMVTGPGAGPELAGQGVLSDLIEVAKARSRG